MALQLQAQCNSCGKLWEKLWAVDGEHFIAACRRCKNVISVSNVTRHCPYPACRAPVPREWVYDRDKIITNYRGHDDVVTECACPRCEEGRLIFHITLHSRKKVKTASNNTLEGTA